MSHVGISESIKQRKRKKVICNSSDDDLPVRTNKPKKKLNRFNKQPVKEAVIVLEDIKK